MPSLNILRESPVYDTFRSQQIMGMFDLPKTKKQKIEWKVDLPIEDFKWDIGLIVGPSGSGKSTIASEVFGNIHTGFDWKNDQPLVDNFPDQYDIKTIVKTLTSVGLSSTPHWIKPFNHLSNGQQFRAELARLLLSEQDIIVFDEFTSIVDRDVAKVCSAALQKSIKGKDGAPRFVAVSCHYDIIDWLNPDWVYDVGSKQYERRRERTRPTIELQVYSVKRNIWEMFREHHYLTHQINTSAKCFIATYNRKPVAFCSYNHSPHPKSKNIKREHRTVVLPDFQGMGIGNTFSEFIGQHCLDNGYRFTSTTSHPNMIRHRAKSLKWKRTLNVGHRAGSHTALKGLHKSAARNTVRYEYIGEK